MQREQKSEPNPPSPFPRREGGDTFRRSSPCRVGCPGSRPAESPPSLAGKGDGGLGLLAIPRPAWEPLRAAYLDRVRPWAEDRIRRMSRREKHPVYDFLFEYYSFRPAHLLRWSPGVNVVLDGATLGELGWAEFSPLGNGLVLLPSVFPAHRV